MPRATRKNSLPILAAPTNTVAAMLGVRADDLHPAIKSGALPSYKVGTRRRIIVEDAIEWLRSNQKSGGPHAG